MILLTVNTGSSSVRLDLFEAGGEEPIRFLRWEGTEKDRPEELLDSVADTVGTFGVGAVAHRVVHGGRFQEPRMLDEETLKEIELFSPVAPLHNPRAIEWIRACRERWGAGVPQAAVFDTAFFTHLPHAAAAYALPRDLVQRHNLRRYGFHGLAHQAMWRRWCQLRPDLPGGGRLITLQLGAGCSIAAVDHGRPRDTSMGFSPLEGLVMATRPGDLDPGLVTFLQKAEGWTPEQMEDVLHRSSGLLGLSGLSGDTRELLAHDSEEAREAMDLYVHRARRYIGAYLSVLNGADGLVFGGGAGENSSALRWMILTDMEWCGLRMDEMANDMAQGKEGRLSAEESRIDAWVIPVDEAGELAREGLRVLSPVTSR